MERRSGSATSVQRDMLSNLIGKHTQKLVALGSTNATVELYFRGRRDSFITHRAFCDALAEETARVNAASNGLAAVSTNFNYHHLMGTTPVGPNMAQHFSSVFKPISSNDQTMDRSRRGLSLWVSQGPQVHHEVIGGNNSIQEIHQIGSTGSSGAIFGDPLFSSSNPSPSDHFQLNWPFFGNKLLSSCNGHEQLTSNDSLPLNNAKEAAAAVQLVTVPSLYSNQQQSHQTTSANMSATALLQKAAQIGATSTDPSFLGSFGLKYSSNSTQVQEGNKYCGLMYGSNPVSTSTNLASDDTAGNDISSLNHQLQMYPTAKRQKIQSDQDSAGGQTRDFLGVGVQQAICHPSTINGWI
ncbi:hypothetical protein GH714_043619 [Hevea brasiliensis]|uniref:BIRD-IDD transcription factor fourth C2HC zinc finger domain-containing protein n=1 Tax=Hevea brasiliensis TaxID=3981 RepID=A0A6A6K3P0_HEVBR|nr:hypothetical protein GH714_043619 [Hevea brasiliensis]